MDSHFVRIIDTTSLRSVGSARRVAPSVDLPQTMYLGRKNTLPKYIDKSEFKGKSGFLLVFIRV